MSAGPPRVGMERGERPCGGGLPNRGLLELVEHDLPHRRLELAQTEGLDELHGGNRPAAAATSGSRLGTTATGGSTRATATQA